MELRIRCRTNNHGVKKILRKSQPQIREKLRQLSLRKKGVFLIKKVYMKTLTVSVMLAANILHKEISKVSLGIFQNFPTVLSIDVKNKHVC